MQRLKGLQKKQSVGRPNTMQEDEPTRPQIPLAKAIESRIAQLDRLYADLTKKLVELEATISRPRDSKPANGKTLEGMSRSTIGTATETRCKNLRETLKAIERARLAEQVGLAITLQD